METTTAAPTRLEGERRRLTRTERTIVACSILKGLHRWAAPFSDGDTCACGALYLHATPIGGAVYEVHDA